MDTESPLAERFLDACGQVRLRILDALAAVPPTMTDTVKAACSAIRLRRDITSTGWKPGEPKLRWSLFLDFSEKDQWPCMPLMFSWSYYSVPVFRDEGGFVVFDECAGYGEGKYPANDPGLRDALKPLPLAVDDITVGIFFIEAIPACWRLLAQVERVIKKEMKNKGPEVEYLYDQARLLRIVERSGQAYVEMQEEEEGKRRAEKRNRARL